MRTILKNAALASGIMLTSVGFAQNNTKPATAPAAKPAATTTAPMAASAAAPATAATWAPLQVEQLKTSLTLKPEQVTKITDLNNSFNKRYEQLKKDEATIGAQAFPGRVSSLTQERNKQVRMVLDAAQQKKWDAMYPAPAPVAHAKAEAPAKKDSH